LIKYLSYPVSAAIAETLKTANIKNRSQNYLAKSLRSSRSTVNQWVNGVSDPLTEATVRLVHVLFEYYGQAACQQFLNALFQCDRPSALFRIELVRKGDRAIAPNEQRPLD
jgi:hypothetical protein